MKITDARVIVSSPGRNYITVKIEVTGGVHGIGDGTLNGRELAVASYLEDHLLPLIMGRDPDDIEDIWQMLYKGAYLAARAGDHGGNCGHRRRPVGHQGQGARHPPVEPARWPFADRSPGLFPRERPSA